MVDTAITPSKYTPLEECGFSPRTLNALIEGRVGCIEQLLEKRREIHNFRGMGSKALKEINEFLDTWMEILAKEPLTTIEKAQIVSAIVGSSIPEALKVKAITFFIK